jgi:bis(5'-nucleosyl)-tetraphosphatase (symmetrical)
MSIYAIGDVQGCHQQILALVQKVHSAEPDARLIFVGDLVNRGPGSLESLRFIRGLGKQAQVLLGNHDLHLLAVANGIRKEHRSDTLRPILDAPDRDDLLDWVRQQPLALFEAGHLLVHAGVLPQWTAQQALELAGEVSGVLRGENWLDFLHHMYGNTPEAWRDDLQGNDRWRCIVNALTRMRFCSVDGKMEFSSTESAGGAPYGYLPWFDVPERKSADTTIVFGHWSTLGLTLRDNLIGLDTGCVWGGKLTAVRLHDRHLVQVDCPQAQKPGK